MSFLDKITDAAATIGDRAGDAIEATKIKTKINGEKRELDGIYVKLGKIFYHQIKEEGLEGGCDAKELVCEADLKMQAIAELEAELSKI
ncbi:MAG: hypothetical protein UC961_02505 [Emergencia sp.]|nr:hypothetical protein [Emergencia sp.]